MSSDAAPTVSSTAGLLRGRTVETAAGSVSSFGGVRYATAARFSLPEPVAPWSGEADATAPGPSAPQSPLAADPGPDPIVPDAYVAAIDEDCLRAEIWTPQDFAAAASLKPVLVWIPGGRFQSGGAALATYDGALLAAEGDMVVVGLNYRLGAFGFLVDADPSNDGVPANLGLRDLLAALRWLRSEVAAFGGDPDRMVVMGESAGAGAIAHLLAIPETETLIAGAIMASGAPASTLAPEAGGQVTAALLEAAGVTSVDDLRALPLKQLLAAQVAADAELLATVGMMPFHPIVDGELLTTSPMDAARAGTFAAVPLIVGTTADEMELFRSAVPELDETIAAMFASFKLAGVVGHEPTPEAVAAGLAACDGDLVRAVADLDLHLPASLIAQCHADRELPVWRYLFDWPAPTIGAAHATDLPFHFGTLDVATWRTFLGADGAAARPADRLSASMRAAWAAFCHELVPACGPVGSWPPNSSDAAPVVVLGTDITVADAPDGDRLGAWLS